MKIVDCVMLGRDQFKLFSKVLSNVQSSGELIRQIHSTNKWVKYSGAEEAVFYFDAGVQELSSQAKQVYCHLLRIKIHKKDQTQLGQYELFFDSIIALLQKNSNCWSIILHGTGASCIELSLYARDFIDDSLLKRIQEISTSEIETHVVPYDCLNFYVHTLAKLNIESRAA